MAVSRKVQVLSSAPSNKGYLHPDPVFLYLATLDTNLMVGNPGTGDVLQCLVDAFDA
jgi:hypothetical protein